MLTRTIIAAALGVALSAGSAGAAGLCQSHHLMKLQLFGKHHEVMIGEFSEPYRPTLELWASHEGGWSIVARKGKLSCLLESGRDWSLPVIKLGTRT